MNPLLIAQLLAPLLAGRAQVLSAPTAEPEERAAAGINPAVLLAMLQALQRPAEPAPEITLPRSAAVVAAIVVIGFFALLAAIAGLLLFGSTERFGAALAVLCVGFGVLASKFGTIIDYLFGSSWGSRTKDAARGDGDTVVLPPPTIPALPAPSAPQEPTQPAPGTAVPAPEPVSVDGIGRSTSESTAGVRSDVPGNGVPASIRYNNPGAQYPSARAAAFGQLGYGIIGGGHKIADGTINDDAADKWNDLRVVIGFEGDKPGDPR
jgi:hypothetical protein